MLLFSPLTLNKQFPKVKHLSQLKKKRILGKILKAINNYECILKKHFID